MFSCYFIIFHSLSLALRLWSDCIFLIICSTSHTFSGGWYIRVSIFALNWTTKSVFYPLFPSLSLHFFMYLCSIYEYILRKVIKPLPSRLYYMKERFDNLRAYVSSAYARLLLAQTDPQINRHLTKLCFNEIPVLARFLAEIVSPDRISVIKMV
jgi:hypothetical protein